MTEKKDTHSGETILAKIPRYRATGEVEGGDAVMAPADGGKWVLYDVVAAHFCNLAAQQPSGDDQQVERCPLDSDWCDGKLCGERGVECPNADPAASGLLEKLEAEVERIKREEARYSGFPVGKGPRYREFMDIADRLQLLIDSERSGSE